MPSDFQVSGTRDFVKLSKALKAAGRTEMRKGLNKGLRSAAKPMIPVLKQAAAEAFPKRGGLAAREAKTRFRIQVRTGSEPGVRVVADGRYVNIKLSNTRGVIRHPVFADPAKTRREWKWVNQSVGQVGWADRAVGLRAHEVVPALEKVMQDVVEQIARGVRG